MVDDVGVIRPTPGSSTLERRAARDDLARRIERTRTGLEAAEARAGETRALRSEAESRVAGANEALEAARRERRIADGAERSTASTAENAARELAWQEAMLERVRAEAELASAESETLARDLSALDASMPDRVADPTARRALAALDARVAGLRAERDRAAAVATAARAERERALEEQRRAEVGLGLAEARIAELDGSETALAGREADVAAGRERSAAALASAQARLHAETEAYESSVAASRAERADLLAAEVGGRDGA